MNLPDNGYRDDLAITFILNGDVASASRVICIHGVENTDTVLRLAVFTRSFDLIKCILTLPETMVGPNQIRVRGNTTLTTAIDNRDVEILRFIDSFGYAVDDFTKAVVSERWGVEVSSISDIINILTISGVHSE